MKLCLLLAFSILFKVGESEGSFLEFFPSAQSLPPHIYTQNGGICASLSNVFLTLKSRLKLQM